MKKIETDEIAFSACVEPIKKPLYNFIRKTLDYSIDTDDVFQDTLLKGFRYFHAYDRDRDFKTWMFTIAHNLVKSLYVLRKAHASVSLEESGEIPSEGGKIDSEILEIYAAAQQLKPRHREVFFLYYYNDFTVSEIGQITGLTKTTIKFVLHQARQKIKKKLEVNL